MNNILMTVKSWSPISGIQICLTFSEIVFCSQSQEIQHTKKI